MIYVFGQDMCNTCKTTQSILDMKEISFQYYDIGKVYEDKVLMSLRNKIKKQATKERGKDYPLPLISRDETLIELDELL